MSVELYDGALDYFIKDPLRNNDMFNLDLIPMFISALEKFSQEINISDLAGFKLKGIFFLICVKINPLAFSTLSIVSKIIFQTKMKIFKCLVDVIYILV